MKKVASIEIRDAALTDLIFEGFERLEHRYALHAASMKEALQEVIENILLYAYDDPGRFMIKAVFSLDLHTFRIDVTDTGIPFDFGRYRSESLSMPTDHTKGFYRIYDLIDRFYFTNVAGIGKCFTLIDSIDFSPTPASLPPVPSSAQPDITQITVRPFDPNDAEGIARLIYRNYDYTYYKTLYYEAEAIRNANEEGEIFSVVALFEEEIVGHFAMIPSVFSPIAEIGAAVVDPRYKRLGIMNRMFDLLLKSAQKQNLHAIYGEGMMLHPYSQKANLRHGMTESAILLGEVIETMEIEHQLKNTNRSGVVVAFLLFDRSPRNLALPKRYRDLIVRTYESASIPLQPSDPILQPHVPPISHRFNPLLKTGTLVIESDIEVSMIDAALEALFLHHCDMIFADINLHRIKTIDEVVHHLNERRFFYAGVMFSFYRGEDYLRLQRKNARHIEEEQLVCHSSFARELLAAILRDEEALP